MQSEPPPDEWQWEMTEKRWDTWIPVCHKDSDCEPKEGFVAECFNFHMTVSKDGTEFYNGVGCYLSPEAFCPGPVLALENLNYENTKNFHHFEATCNNKGDEPEPVNSSDESSSTMWFPFAAICIALLVILSLIVPSCLCCCGMWGKNTCWYDCFRLNKNKRSVHGAEPEMYLALSEMTAQSGLPPSKIKAYVEVLEKYDVFNKHALF